MAPSDRTRFAPNSPAARDIEYYLHPFTNLKAHEENGPLIVNEGKGIYVYDDQGNVQGGIRTSYVDAASAVLLGEANLGDRFCFLFGTTSLFTPEQMATLYVDEAGYVMAVTEATNAAVAEGFLLQEDADAIITWAPQQWRSQSGE